MIIAVLSKSQKTDFIFCNTNTNGALLNNTFDRAHRGINASQNGFRDQTGWEACITGKCNSNSLLYAEGTLVQQCPAETPRPLP